MRSTFGSSRILTRLGVKGGQQPDYAGESLTPVALLADFSSSFAPEAIEARQIFAEEQSVALIDLAGVWQYHARGAGGCVVEYLRMESDNAAALCGIRISPTPAITGTATPMVNIGGQLARSACVTTAGGGGASTLSKKTPWENVTGRLYIPAGSFLIMKVTVIAAHVATMQLVVREIPEIAGAP